MLIILAFAWQALEVAREARQTRKARTKQYKQREISQQRLRRMWIVDDPDSGMTIKARQFHTNFYDQDTDL